MKKNNDEIEIDLLELFRALWKKALVIILVAGVIYYCWPSPAPLHPIAHD